MKALLDRGLEALITTDSSAASALAAGVAAAASLAVLGVMTMRKGPWADVPILRPQLRLLDADEWQIAPGTHWRSPDDKSVCAVPCLGLKPIAYLDHTLIYAYDKDLRQRGQWAPPGSVEEWKPEERAVFADWLFDKGYEDESLWIQLESARKPYILATPIFMKPATYRAPAAWGDDATIQLPLEQRAALSEFRCEDRSIDRMARTRDIDTDLDAARTALRALTNIEDRSSFGGKPWSKETASRARQAQHILRQAMAAPLIDDDQVPPIKEAMVIVGRGVELPIEMPCRVGQHDERSQGSPAHAIGGLRKRLSVSPKGKMSIWTNAYEEGGRTYINGERTTVTEQIADKRKVWTALIEADKLDQGPTNP